MPTDLEKERLAHWHDALDPPEDENHWYDPTAAPTPRWAYALPFLALGVGVLALWLAHAGPFAS